MTELTNIKTQYFSFAHADDPFILESGEQLTEVTLAYETYGTLNADKSNAVLIVHALSGDAHAAGFYADEDKPGWWDAMIGPGKAFDTNKYFVICSNVLGGCKGSTGPASMDPATQKPYGLDFPVISINDMVNCQYRLVEHLGVETLLCVAGGSMGGMQVVSWMIQHPKKIKSAIPIATAMKHSPQQIAFNEVARQAIMADPHWNEGNYYDAELPARGLAVARMIGHITYMSDTSMQKKFGREKKGVPPLKKFTADFEVEGYLRYRGDSFVKRFDANTFLYLTEAMDHFDPAGDKPAAQLLQGAEAKILVMAFKSDWLYPAYQSKEIVKACKFAGVPVTYCEIDSTYGHDAFLLEIEEETHLVSHFLKNLK